MVGDVNSQREAMRRRQGFTIPGVSQHHPFILPDKIERHYFIEPIGGSHFDIGCFGFWMHKVENPLHTDPCPARGADEIAADFIGNTRHRNILIQHGIILTDFIQG